MREKKSRRIVGGGIGDVGEGEKRGRKNEYGLVCLRSSYSVCVYILSVKLWFLWF